MNIKRFFGKNSREALSMVRKELGDDAVILSNRAMNGGNEIMAFKEEALNHIVEAAQAEQKSDKRRQPGKLSVQTPVMNTQAFNSKSLNSTNTSVNTQAFNVQGLNKVQNARQHTARFDPHEPMTLRSLIHNSRTQPQENPTTQHMGNQSTSYKLEDHDYDEMIKRAEANKHIALEKSIAQKPVQTPKSVATQPVPVVQQQYMNVQANAQISEMMNEMRNMRTVIEAQLTALTWGNIQQRDPSKSKILSNLLSAGFSASLSRQLAEKMPENLSEEKANAWVKSILAINLNTIENDAEILDQGGVFALIGPTGVGKTTTTAKLAARYVMKHGTQNLGIITTDAYRIGGHEQLRIYGKILGVMVHAVKDEADLKIALSELKNKHTILIDTVGVSQRDRMVAEQIAMLSNTNIPIKKLLCLNATNTGETLTDVISAYKGKGLDGCLITKLDEAATIGNTLDVIIREKLKLYYVANGQRVPEDIHLANKQYLIQHALKLSTKKLGANKSNESNTQAFQFMEEELPFIMGNTVNAAQSSQLSGISYV